MRLAPALEAAGEDAGLSDGGVRLMADIDPDAEIIADPDQLHRILVNLLSNTRQAVAASPGPAPGRVRVSLERRGPDMVIRLADNGPGVPERAMPRLFQPFAGSGRAGGAGLGLAISRELAQAHGGDLVLVESGPEGAIFELRLPAVPPPANPSAAATTADPPESGGETQVSRSAPRPRGAGPRRPRVSRRVQ